MIELDLARLNDREVIAVLDNLSPSIRRVLSVKVKSLTLRLEARIKRKLSGEVLNVRTGNLRRSIQSSFEETDDMIKGTVYSAGDVKYARIWELGGVIPPHIIEAKAGKALRFSAGGAEIFRRRVKHPGATIAARPYMRPSLQEMQKTIIDEMSDAVKGVVDV